MFKVLLVDDEPLITQGLQALIDWEDYGFDVMATASNGAEALEYIKKHPIDLLVTDIVMPKMTGLELIERAKKVRPGIKCIILSGYEEFDYIKQGIRLGVENYLTKPVDEIELEQTIEATSEGLHLTQKEGLDEDNVLKENVLWRLLYGDIHQAEREERLSFYAIDQSQPFYVVSIIDFSHSYEEAEIIRMKEQLETRYQANSVIGINNELVLILHGEHEEELYTKNNEIAAFLKKQCEKECTFYLAMGDIVEGMETISDSYFKARENSLYQIVMEPNTVISNQTHIDKHSLLKQQQFYKNDLVKRIHQSKAATYEGIDAFFDCLSKENAFLSPAVLRKYTIDLVTYIHHSIQDVKHYNHTTAIEKIVKLSSNEQIKEILIAYCDELIDAMHDQDENRSPIVTDVLEYIHASYHEELSLKTLSQRFHVNSIYLGQLFQKEMGIVFSEYINQFRLEKAKELLKTTHLTAGEIGKKVGYSDTTYFYKQFKKYVSVTPTEWRKV